MKLLVNCFKSYSLNRHIDKTPEKINYPHVGEGINLIFHNTLGFPLIAAKVNYNVSKC